MTTPALLRLREAKPDAHITLLTSEKIRDLWLKHPAINEVQTFKADESFLTVGNRLRKGRYDIAVIFPNSPRSALEVWWARIPRRIGYARSWRNSLLTDVIQPSASEVKMHKRSEVEIKQLVAEGEAMAKLPASAHQIHHYLNLVASLGANPEPIAPKLEVTEEAVTNFTEKFKLETSPENPRYFAMNPAAEYGPAKCWPEDRFAEAAIQIQKATNCRWLIFGLTRDKEMAERIASKINNAAKTPQTAAVNLAGATRLDELCAALKFCRVLLTNDSGPMHVAAALGTPVVVPFGSTSPELTGPSLPGDPRHRLLRANAPCSPCFLRECPIDFRCMTGIQVTDVVKAVLEIIT